MRMWIADKLKPRSHWGLTSILMPLFFPVFLSVPQGQEIEKLQKPLQYEVSVTVKLIQVYVTDKKGKPVMDLARDDFVIFDNGVPVTVTEFEKHELLPAAPAAETEAPAERIVPTPTPSPETINRKFFLFFDFAFNNQRGVDKSVKAALHFLDTQVIPGDEVALLSYSMLKGVTVQEYLTVDHEKVREAVAAVTAKAIAGRAGEVEEQYWRQVSIGAPSESDTRSTASFDRQARDIARARQESKIAAKNYILRLAALAKALRLVPGQKSFILFSSGIPSSLIYGSQSGNPAQLRGRGAFDTGDMSLRPLNEEMYKEFSTANCAFYIFDTRESAKVPSLFAYDEQTFESGHRDILSAQGVFQTTTDPFRDDKTTGLDSLKRLSDRTAGKFFSNINMYEKNLSQVQELTGAYYVLGYSISEQWDGRFHEIKVEVKRKGCEVRAQAGYFNPKPFREYSDLEKKLHLFDLALNERSQLQTPKNFPMEVLSYSAGEGPRLRLMARVPSEALEDFAGKSVEFVALAFDDSENLVDLKRTEVDLTGYRGMDILFSSGVSAPPGRYTCRFVLRDLDTGMSAVASTRADIARDTAALSLHTPLLLAPVSCPVYLEAVGTGKPDLLSWRDVYLFDRKQYSPLVGEISKEVSSVLVVVAYTISGIEQPNVILSANLIKAATGERLPVSFYSQARFRSESVEIQHIEFSLDDVPPGEYLLYIHAGDPASGAMTHVQTRLVIIP
jgi:VWFA-related protein